MGKLEQVCELLGVNPRKVLVEESLQRFECVPYSVIKEIANMLGDSFLNERQNYAPSTAEFLERTECYAQDTVFHGYVIYSTYYGLQPVIEAVTTVKADDVITAFRGADDFDLSDDELYAWWD